MTPYNMYFEFERDGEKRCRVLYNRHSPSPIRLMYQANIVWIEQGGSIRIVKNRYGEVGVVLTDKEAMILKLKSTELVL